MSYIDKSTIVIIPTRGMLHHKVVASLLQLSAPLNHKRRMMFVSGMEVAEAYNAGVKRALELSPAFIMTLEDDNLAPPDAHIRLIDAIEDFDAVSGLYHSKDVEHVPLVFDEDMMPMSIKGKSGVIRVGGIPMGCGLWRADIFRSIPFPWFETIDNSHVRWTHDLVFCEKMRLKEMRIGVDLDLKVGHLDVATEVVY